MAHSVLRNKALQARGCPCPSRSRSALVVKATKRLDKFSKKNIIVSPSILSADFAKLGDEVGTG